MNMKKIVLLGKFTDEFRDLKECLDKSFDVQICIDNVQLLKGMLKVKCPDLVVICLAGVGTNMQEIFEELKDNYSKLPVICIGENEEVDMYNYNIGKEQFIMLVSPIENEKIVEEMHYVLDEAAKEQLNNEYADEKKSILLVDDSNIQLRALNVMLKDKYDVRMATSGMQALNLVGKEKPDMIFLDYEMPICDGRRVLELLREEEGTKDIPVVFLTGVSDKEHIQAVLELKPAGYLLKPADASRIFEIIEKVLG